MLHLNENTYPLFGDVAEMDHLWSIVQEATNASQPQ